MKKILVIGDTDIFVKRFVEYFSHVGYEVCLLTFAPIIENVNVKVIVMPYKRPYGGFMNLLFALRIARNFKPDILHVFSGGTDALLGSLLGIRPAVLNVYGTEIFDVPYRSFLHKFFIRRNLKYYDQICSTSQMMAIGVDKLITSKNPVIVTPFGVDLNEFVKRNSEKRDSSNIIIGTVKRLKKKYGIDTLIRAFYQVKLGLEDRKDITLKLLIVGDGVERNALIRLTQELGISDYVVFTGHVPNANVPSYLNTMDVFVALSRLESESFGVAIVEASAMGIPVVCSNIGGLPEVVNDGETGFLVEVDNASAAADRILELVLNEELRVRLGNNGRKFISEKYSFKINADKLVRAHSVLFSRYQQ